MQKVRCGQPIALQKAQNLLFKKLYQECKENTALFIKHVDNQIQTILCNHEQQKKKLLNEIHELKKQINQQKYIRLTSERNRQLTSLPMNRQLSLTLQSIHAESIEQEISQWQCHRTPRFETKRVWSQRKIAYDGLISTGNENTSSKVFIYEKENDDFIWKQEKSTLAARCPQKPLKPNAFLLGIRQKRLKQAVNHQQKVENAQNIKDLLRNIRVSVDCNHKSKLLNHKLKNEERVLTIITPEMLNKSLAGKD